MSGGCDLNPPDEMIDPPDDIQFAAGPGPDDPTWTPVVPPSVNEPCALAVESLKIRMNYEVNRAGQVVKDFNDTIRRLRNLNYTGECAAKRDRLADFFKALFEQVLADTDRYRVIAWGQINSIDCSNPNWHDMANRASDSVYTWRTYVDDLNGIHQQLIRAIDALMKECGMAIS